MDLVDSNAVVQTSFEYKILRARLTQREKRIFEKWKKNSTETQLPLITLSDVYKIPVDTLLLDNIQD